MSLLHFSVLFIVFAAFAVDTSLSIDCYECASADSSGCGDPFSKSDITTKKDCKACVKAKATAGGTTAVTRACFPTAKTAGCTDGEYAGVTGEVCYCDSNLCNSGTVLKYAPLMSFLLAVMSMIYNVLYY